MKDLIYPTFVFMLFLCALGFVAFYTYKGAASYEAGKKSSVTSVESFQSEMNKKIK